MYYIPAFVAVILVNGAILWRMLRLVECVLAQSRSERRGLEDRLIAMTDRDASVMVHAQENSAPAEVTYIDEAREYELSASSG